MRESPYLEVLKSKNGKGVFAACPLPAGLALLEITGKKLSFEDTLKLGDKESYALQVDDHEYIALHFPFFLVNHSCNPNCGITPELVFKTIKAINKGEELRWDYSTSMYERSWTIPCNCGAPNCRKVIADFDTIPAEQQQYYLRQDIVLPFIRKKLCSM